MPKEKESRWFLPIVPMTEIKPSTNVVCSQEAKQMLKILLDSQNPNLIISKLDGELALFRNNMPLYSDSGSAPTN